LSERQPSPPAAWERFPSTRYQGSKRKLLPLLAEVFGGLEFDTALDPFCGTGAVSYLLKSMGKEVRASDLLEFNAVAAEALVVNRQTRLGRAVDDLVSALPAPGRAAGFVEQTYDEVFFERDENRFIDQILPRIHALESPARELALHALGQACLAKRPYNLFHRANLSMRRRDVSRSFGNKTTWDTPFADLMRRFAGEADCAVFDSGRDCSAKRADIAEVDLSSADLVYLDPPYVAGSGAGVDYLDFYHFLEGICAPGTWAERVLHRYKHKPLEGRGRSAWADRRSIEAVFSEAIGRCGAAIVVVSYRSDGVPGVEDIEGDLVRAGKSVEVIDAGKYTYALSRNRRSREVVLVGR
jgi:adenine-specific DNA methylase